MARRGATVTTKEALERVHGLQNEFVLHIDLDVIASEDFPATNLAASGGLRLQDLAEALGVLAQQPKLAALVISAYNPALDPEGAAARRFIELLTKALAGRLAPATPTPEAPASDSSEPPATPSTDSTSSAAAN
jgi:arginase